MYNSCSKSNASYFILLAPIRGGCWNYSSLSWTFPPIFHYVSLLSDRWQLRGSLTEWCMMWKWYWNPSRQNNGRHCHSLTLAECWWRSTSGCEHGVAGGGALQQSYQCWERQAALQAATNGHHTMKLRKLQSSHSHKLLDYDQRTAYRAKHQFQCIGNDGSHVRIPQSLLQVGPTNAHTGAERTPYAHVMVLWSSVFHISIPE